MLKKGCFWAFFMGFLVTFWAFFLVFCRFSDIKRAVFFWEYPRELSLPLSAPPQLSLWIISPCKLRERSRCCPVPSIWESPAGSFSRFQSLLLYSRKSPPFLLRSECSENYFYSVSKFSFFKSAAPFVRFALENPFTEITPQNSPFLYGLKIPFFLCPLSVRSFGSSGAAPPLPCVFSCFPLASHSEQRPFYILRKLRKFNFVYRPVNLLYTDLWTYHAE